MNQSLQDQVASIEVFCQKLGPSIILNIHGGIRLERTCIGLMDYTSHEYLLLNPKDDDYQPYFPEDSDLVLPKNMILSRDSMSDYVIILAERWTKHESEKDELGRAIKELYKWIQWIDSQGVAFLDYIDNPDCDHRILWTNHRCPVLRVR